MHAFVRKGLLLSATAGALVMGYASTAAAQGGSATAGGAAGDSPGAVSGNVAQVPADIPIQVCGDAVAAGAALVGAHDNDCRTEDTTAEADGFAAGSPGALSGNVGSVAANVPVQACGLAGGALAAGVTAHNNDCEDTGTHALATGAAAGSPGLASGNVLQLSADAPVQACGDAVALLGVADGAMDNHCVNGAPEMAPPPTTPPPAPPMTPPAPPPGPCPPSNVGTTLVPTAALLSEIPASRMPASPMA